MDTVQIAIAVAVGVIAVTIVGHTVLEVREQHEAFVEKSEQWCQSHGGTLELGYADSVHSGVYCDIQYKTVDMAHVADRGWPQWTLNLKPASEMQHPVLGVGTENVVKLLVGFGVSVLGIAGYNRYRNGGEAA